MKLHLSLFVALLISGCASPIYVESSLLPDMRPAEPLSSCKVSVVYNAPEEFNNIVANNQQPFRTLAQTFERTMCKSSASPSVTVTVDMISMVEQSLNSKMEITALALGTRGIPIRNQVTLTGSGSLQFEGGESQSFQVSASIDYDSLRDGTYQTRIGVGLNKLNNTIMLEAYNRLKAAN